MRVSDVAKGRSRLTDLAVELSGKSEGLRRSLPAGVAEALASLVRSMNCYYSNLIEGHNTHPIDIERALNGDYSHDPRKRDLQLEAQAHIAVQAWIDEGGLAGRATSAEGVCELHRRFCERLPEDLLWVETPDGVDRIRVIPGAYRTRDVQVGRHIPISPGAVTRFMGRFEQGFGKLGRTEQILSAAAAHHRLLWIHPFIDGNGRVARLMSYAMLQQGLDTGGLWSIARGLARNEAAYKSHLANCDLPRRNDLDGRGALSEEALVGFIGFFLEICLDQVQFMEQLIQPDRLHRRIRGWAEEEVAKGALPAKSPQVLEALLYRGTLTRAEIAERLGVVDRHARRVTSALLRRGVLAAPSPRSALRLAFPASLASTWMPGLFPDQDD